MNTTSGIHHVTAIASDARNNVDFYTRLLGLRLVKKTVNFDDPTSYHFYYGDGVGSPGTILTHFIWPGGRRTRSGYGEVNTTALVVPENSLEWWKSRFDREGIASSERPNRWGEDVLEFLDPDGLKFELIAASQYANPSVWTGGDVSEAHAIRGVHSVTLAVTSRTATAEVLKERLGFVEGEVDGLRARFIAKSDNHSIGRYVDVLTVPDSPRAGGGAGAVHHVAFRASDDAAQAGFRADLVRHNLQVSPVMDRNYFRSIYFREPGGVLFEIATDSPGFAIDENAANLGETLKLPVQYEKYRSEIEARLQPLDGPYSEVKA